MLLWDSFDAVLFDMDGTLTNNAHFHEQAWEKVLQERYQYQLIANDPRVHGGKTKFIVESLLERTLSDAEATEFHNYKEATYRKIAQGQIQAIPGLNEYLKALEQHQKKWALVTSADAINTQFVLTALGLEQRFMVKVMAEDVQHGKPHPEPFLLGANKLGITAQHCIAHEDSVAGIHSARDAGCQVIGMSSNQPASTLLTAGATRVISNYWELLTE